MARLEYITLHFNVFLLKLTPPDILRFLNKNFTFQCVSIKVVEKPYVPFGNNDALHFNVFLLKSVYKT